MLTRIQDKIRAIVLSQASYLTFSALKYFFYCILEMIHNEFYVQFTLVLESLIRLADPWKNTI